MNEIFANYEYFINRIKEAYKIRKRGIKLFGAINYIIRIFKNIFKLLF
ncbi:MAG: hypothetical protein PHU74_00635 [Candidatus Pacebacteria bacterium]|nr:hypothetical protein [Candidatus Paceibacterota bacterium]